jgi:hypothetical protein
MKTPKMQNKAAALGEEICRENGIDVAVKLIDNR